jgi:hypothetical protein
MDHKGVRYEILQTANPTGWKWFVYLPNGKTKTGVSHSKGTALFRAFKAIDEAEAKANEGPAQLAGSSSAASPRH